MIPQNPFPWIIIIFNHNENYQNIISHNQITIFGINKIWSKHHFHRIYAQNFTSSSQGFRHNFPSMINDQNTIHPFDYESPWLVRTCENPWYFWKSRHKSDRHLLPHKNIKNVPNIVSFNSNLIPWQNSRIFLRYFSILFQWNFPIQNSELSRDGMISSPWKPSSKPKTSDFASKPSSSSSECPGLVCCGGWGCLAVSCIQNQETGGSTMVISMIWLKYYL